LPKCPVADYRKEERIHMDEKKGRIKESFTPSNRQPTLGEMAVSPVLTLN
jgi:hypothetical protein